MSLFFRGEGLHADINLLCSSSGREESRAVGPRLFDSVGRVVYYVGVLLFEWKALSCDIVIVLMESSVTVDTNFVAVIV